MGGTASQAASVLGLDPGDFQVAPAYAHTQQRGKGAQQQQQRTTPVIQHQLKDKGKSNGKSQGKSKGGKPQKVTWSPCFNWNRSPDGCVDGPCPNDRDHACEKCGGSHRGCHCQAGGKKAHSK